jgi:DNA-binding NtrC family response regulator
LHTSVHAAKALEGGLDEKMDEFEKGVIEMALLQNQGHLERTATALNIPRKKLYLRMRKHQVNKT